jgi:hypothetical protein
MKKYYYALMYLSITHHILGSRTATAPYQETVRYAYWQPVSLQTVEKQLHEAQKIDDQIAELRQNLQPKKHSWFSKKNNGVEQQIEELGKKVDYIETQAIKEAIPYLMRQRDEQILNNPMHLAGTYHKTALIEYVTSDEYEEPQDETEIKTGPYYETLKKVKSYYPQLAHIDVLLKHRTPEADSSSSSGIDPIACNGIDKKTGKYQISLLPTFYNVSDTNKLHTLLHELNHILYSDSNHSFLRNMRSTNELKNMTSIPLLKAMIDMNHQFIVANIDRYIEWRCDTQAMFAMQCPYCLVELAEETHHSNQQYSNTPGVYHESGYLTTWQMIPRIEQLYRNKSICKYHIDNNSNQAVFDGSSLVRRLEIIHNHPIPAEDQWHIVFTNK